MKSLTMVLAPLSIYSRERYTRPNSKLTNVREELRNSHVHYKLLLYNFFFLDTLVINNSLPPQLQNLVFVMYKYKI